jgi:hypothetical protein
MDLTKPINWPIQPDSQTPPAPLTLVPAPACCKCGSQMEEGFVVDRGYDSNAVSTWVAGKPEFGFFGSLKFSAKPQQDIHTFACVACGYLESYICRPRPASPPA